MKMACLFIFLCPLQFLSSVFCNFNCRDLCLNSFLIFSYYIYKYTYIHTYIYSYCEWDWLLDFFLSWFVISMQKYYFCILILHPATLQNSFFSSNSLFVEALCFSMYNAMPSANRVNFTSSFPEWMSFLSPASLFCLWLPILYWAPMMNVEISVLEEIISVFPHLLGWWLWACQIKPLL
jgi:hypothetical protein